MRAAIQPRDQGHGLTHGHLMQANDGRHMPMLASPDRLPADHRTWWGSERESAELQAHHRRMDERYRRTREAAYSLALLSELEAGAFRMTVQRLVEQEHLLASLDAGSFSEAVAQTLMLKMTARTHQATSDIIEEMREQFRRNR